MGNFTSTPNSNAYTFAPQDPQPPPRKKARLDPATTPAAPSSAGADAQDTHVSDNAVSSSSEQRHSSANSPQDSNETSVGSKPPRKRASRARKSTEQTAPIPYPYSYPPPAPGHSPYHVPYYMPPPYGIPPYAMPASGSSAAPHQYPASANTTPYVPYPYMYPPGYGYGAQPQYPPQGYSYQVAQRYGGPYNVVTQPNPVAAKRSASRPLQPKSTEQVQKRSEAQPDSAPSPKSPSAAPASSSQGNTKGATKDVFNHYKPDVSHDRVLTQHLADYGILHTGCKT